MRKKLLLSGSMLLSVFFPATLHAQKHCDLSINILTPADGAVTPFGDTAYISYSITNLGPDTLKTTDTFYFRVVNVSLGTLSFERNLSPGSTFSDTLFSTWHDGSDDGDAELSTCLVLRPELNTSFADTVESNDTSCVTFILKGPPVGIDHISQSGTSALKMYPNPATSSVFIALPEKYTALPHVAVYDLAGRLILEKANINRSSGQEVKVDISGLHQGVYLLKMYTGNDIAYGKLIVQ